MRHDIFVQMCSLPVPEGSLQERWSETLRAFSDRTRGNGTESRFRLDIRKKCVTVGLVRCWNRLLIEVVDSSFLEVFGASLDGALGSLV